MRGLFFVELANSYKYSKISNAIVQQLKGETMARVAVLAASFSLREEEPNPCNVRIAEEAFRVCDELIAEGHFPVLSA